LASSLHLLSLFEAFSRFVQSFLPAKDTDR
jgi:hypothetical protein